MSTVQLVLVNVADIRGRVEPVSSPSPIASPSEQASPAEQASATHAELVGASPSKGMPSSSTGFLSPTASPQRTRVESTVEESIATGSGAPSKAEPQVSYIIASHPHVTAPEAGSHPMVGLNGVDIGIEQDLATADSGGISPPRPSQKGELAQLSMWHISILTTVPAAPLTKLVLKSLYSEDEHHYVEYAPGKIWRNTSSPFRSERSSDNPDDIPAISVPLNPLGKIFRSSATAVRTVFSWLVEAVSGSNEDNEEDDSSHDLEPRGSKRKTVAVGESDVGSGDRSTSQLDEHENKRLQELESGVKTASSGTALFDDKLSGLHRMKDALARRVLGQDEAIDVICEAICCPITRSQSSITPLASFLLLGPRGAGKTELLRTLGEELWPESHRPFFELNMSEYATANRVKPFIDAVVGIVCGQPPSRPPNESQLLFGETFDYAIEEDLIQRLVYRPINVAIEPRIVLAFDNIEEAHPSVAEIIWILFRSGVIIDDRANGVNFKNTIVCLSSSFGCEIMHDHVSTHLNGSVEPQSRSDLINDLKELVSPELIGVVDKQVVFNVLRRNVISDIIRLHVEKAQERLKQHEIQFSISRLAGECLEKAGLRSGYGPRYIVETLLKARREAFLRSSHDDPDHPQPKVHRLVVVHEEENESSPTPAVVSIQEMPGEVK